MKFDIKKDYIIPEKPAIDIQSIYIEPKAEKFIFKRLSLQLGLSMVFLLFLGLTFFVKSPISLSPVVLSAAELDTFSVVSSSMMLEETQKNTLMSQTSKTLFEEKVSLINPYINVFEVFVGEHAPKIIEQTTNIKEGFTHYDQIIIKDALNNEIVYHYHYKKELDDDELEISGILIHHDEMYYIDITWENENGEVEKEFKIYKDKQRKDKDYIYLEIEIEADDQTFAYYIYKDGHEVHKVKVELETDNHKIELDFYVEVKDKLKFSMRLKQLGDKFVGKYKIESDTEEIGYVELQILVDQDTYIYEYTLLNANKKIRQSRSLK